MPGRIWFNMGYAESSIILSSFQHEEMIVIRTTPHEISIKGWYLVISESNPIQKCISDLHASYLDISRDCIPLLPPISSLLNEN